MRVFKRSNGCGVIPWENSVHKLYHYSECLQCQMVILIAGARIQKIQAAVYVDVQTVDI